MNVNIQAAIFSLSLGLLAQFISSELAIGGQTKAIGNIVFTVADGLEFEKVAPDSLIQWPIAGTFDSKGDLLLLECHWNKQRVKDQLESKPHKIVRLADSDGDRVFDKRTVIAKDLGFPEGIMLLGEDILITTPPQILKLSDKDQDGFYEHHEVWYDAGTLTHCANDLHGPMLGPDGWVYWTKGAFAEQKPELIQRVDHQDFETKNSKASHIYRRHPKGGPIERLMTGGMDNPSDLTFSQEGEIFFCSTFLHHPGNGLRDGIAHSPRGGLFGKRHQVIEGHWTTGPLLEPIVNFGPAAPGSVEYLNSNSIPSALVATASNTAISESRFLVSAQFNLQKIALHRLIPDGASFQTESVDLLNADRIDFHPVDTLQESDGSLLILDTGGWYDLCCPSSGSDQSIARGGVYRLKPVAKQVNKRVNFSRAGKSSNSEVATNSAQKKSKIWALSRDITSNPKDIKNVRSVVTFLADEDPSVQQTAAHIAGLNRWKQAVPGLEALLDSPSPPTVRAAMQSLGVVGSSDSIKKVVSAANKYPDDRYITHSAIYALLEIGNREAIEKIVSETEEPHALYVALTAAHQLAHVSDRLNPKLLSLLTSKSDRLRDLSLECLIEKPSGTSHCIPFLGDAWSSGNRALLNASLPIVKRGLSNPKIIELVSGFFSNAETESADRQTWLIDLLKSLNGKTLPDKWAEPLSQWIANQPSNQLSETATSLQSIVVDESLSAKLTAILRARARTLTDQPNLAIKLIACSPVTSDSLEDSIASVILNELTKPDSLSSLDADAALARVTLSIKMQKRLLDQISTVPPLFLPNSIESILKSDDSELITRLLKTLPALSGVRSLQPEWVPANLKNHSEPVQKQWRDILRNATAPPSDLASSLDQWVERLPKGDPVHGYQVFRNSKAACSACHQIGYIGGQVGPELSHIGKSRTRRDLIESIVFPSFRLAQGYVPTRILTEDGQVFNGILVKQTDDSVELLCGVDKICRVPKNEIQEKVESNISVMPSGLEQQISLTDFADLIAYLESRK